MKVRGGLAALALALALAGCKTTSPRTDDAGAYGGDVGSSPDVRDPLDGGPCVLGQSTLGECEL
ncbi:MAG: hypothetical protein JWM82_2101 [Myxococcales bacterium]|nr:hypothetical protein [Myxococcales bacterium]